MLIKYKPKVEHVKCIPLIADPKDPKSYSRTQIQLLPGTNEVSDAEWEAIKPHIAVEIKIGEIEVIKVASKKAGGGKARSLKDVPANIARDLIAKCSNPATLKRWFKEEGRDEILLAVTKRMRKLKIDPDEIEKELEKDSDTLADETDTETTGDDDDDTDTESDEDKSDEDDTTDDDDDDDTDDDDTETTGDDEIPTFDGDEN